MEASFAEIANQNFRRVRRGLGSSGCRVPLATWQVLSPLGSAPLDSSRDDLADRPPSGPLASVRPLAVGSPADGAEARERAYPRGSRSLWRGSSLVGPEARNRVSRRERGSTPLTSTPGGTREPASRASASWPYATLRTPDPRVRRRRRTRGRPLTCALAAGEQRRAPAYRGTGHGRRHPRGTGGVGAPGWGLDVDSPTRTSCGGKGLDGRRRSPCTRGVRLATRRDA